MAEAWRAIVGYEGRYEVSSEGRIRSLDRVEPYSRGGKRFQRRIAGCVLKTPPNADGYPHVPLRIAGKLRLVTVHRLVCRAFHGPPPSQFHEVAHLDGVRSNSTATNVKWVSRAENISHKLLHGTAQTGEQAGHVKLNEAQALAIIQTCGKSKAADVARQYRVSQSAVRDIWSGRNWRHLPR